MAFALVVAGDIDGEGGVMGRTGISLKREVVSVIRLLWWSLLGVGSRGWRVGSEKREKVGVASSWALLSLVGDP